MDMNRLKDGLDRQAARFQIALSQDEKDLLDAKEAFQQAQQALATAQQALAIAESKFIEDKQGQKDTATAALFVRRLVTRDYDRAYQLLFEEQVTEALFGQIVSSLDFASRKQLKERIGRKMAETSGQSEANGQSLKKYFGLLIA